MAAWFNLLVKELRLGWKIFTGILVFILLVSLIGLGLAYYKPYGVVSVIYTAGSSSLLFYLLVYLIVSLSNERSSMSTWMQTPLPGWALYAAKLAAGIVSMIVTGVIVVLLTQLMMAVDGQLSIAEQLGSGDYHISETDFADLMAGEQIVHFVKTHYIDFVTAFSPFLIVNAIILAICYLIVYTASRTLQRWLGRWSILAGIVILYVSVNLYERIYESPLMRLFDWGKQTFLDADVDLSADERLFLDIHLESLAYGPLVLDVIIAGVVVFLCGWLLDRKVEVR